MFQLPLPSPSSLMSPESVPSTMRRLSPQICRDEEVEEVWSGENGEEEEEEERVSNGSLIKECDDGKKAIENCEDRVEEPKVGMEFNTSEEAYLYYSRFAKEKGFAVFKRSSKKGKDGNLYHVIFQCSKGGKPRPKGSNPVKPRPQTKVGCPARLNVCLSQDGKWRLRGVFLEHNHEQSPEKSRFFKSNRVLDRNVKRKIDLNDRAGIRLHKTIDTFQIEAGGPDKLPYLPKDCRNYLDKIRRLRLVEGDAEAMHRYFMRMKADNSDFFYAMDLNDKGRLRNVFWADARSRAACREFGDVVTFDTTYLVNKYDMPFAPFVGVNHHGQSILLGCGLISHEDTESFSWLFQTWMTCMGDCAPKAIITDQCQAMKNAIENVFPNTRHRWCIWHIMKKVPEKLSGYEAYEKISYRFRHAVYDTLTIEEFDTAWDNFIKKYELHSNTWLQGLYLERKRWVPAYVKEVFWAGMSSTQRSESMNAYFDGYINSKTTLKQFVEQYENALTKKVESEKLKDMKSWHSFIPCVTEDELEKQFQSAYTNDKFKEFHEQFVGKINCSIRQKTEGDVWSEYEVKESIFFGEGEERQRKRVPFKVDFNAESNEAYCNCRLFECKGMMCKHQLLVYHDRGIDKVPDKYILKRWCKNVKRAHTKIRISYDKSSNAIEARRHDNMCNLFKEIADLADDSEERYNLVMTRVRELKKELMEADIVCGSNMVDETSTPNDHFSLGDEVLPSKISMNILDPEVVRRKGRPPCKRKQGTVEKAVKKKMEKIKKTLANEKPKEIKDIAAVHVGGTQESVANVHNYPSSYGPVMWPSMRPHVAQGRIGFNQPHFMHNLQSYMPNLLHSQVLGGSQPSVLEDLRQSQGWGGPQLSSMENQWHGWREGQQSFVQMMNETNDPEG